MTAFKDTIKQTSQDGFTLLEILISIAVLAIVMVSLFKLHSSTLELADAARFKRLFPLIARQQLAQIYTDHEAGGTYTGELKEAGRTYQWFCTIENETFDAPFSISEHQAQHFKKIILTVTDTATKKSLSLTTWRYQVELHSK